MKNEVKKSLIAVIIAIGLAASVIVPAYAYSISGTVRSGLNGLANPKITAEKAGEYAWARGTSTGTYSVPVATTNNYQLDAMKGGYSHNRISNVPGGSSGKDFNLSTRTYQVLNVRIAVDEEFRNLYGSNWAAQADSKLRLAEPWFSEEHSINFQHSSNTGTVWVTGGTCKSCTCLHNDMLADTGWPNTNPGGVATVMVGFTGETMAGGGHGCSTNTSPASHYRPASLIENGFTPLDKLVMHELTHLYDFDHQCDTAVWYDIMESDVDINNGQCAFINPNWSKNWRPIGDDTMAANRAWY